LVNGLRCKACHNSHYQYECDACCRGKLKRKSYRKHRVADPNLDILVSFVTDVKGPITPTSFDGKVYTCSFICEKSKFKWIYTLRTKDETADALVEFNSNVIKPLIRAIGCDRLDNGNIQFRTIHSDGGREYLGSFLKNCNEFGLNIHLLPVIPLS
jgi:hypothetical protein